MGWSLFYHGDFLPGGYAPGRYADVEVPGAAGPVLAVENAAVAGAAGELVAARAAPTLRLAVQPWAPTLDYRRLRSLDPIVEALAGGAVDLGTGGTPIPGLASDHPIRILALVERSPKTQRVLQHTNLKHGDVDWVTLVNNEGHRLPDQPRRRCQHVRRTESDLAGGGIDDESAQVSLQNKARLASPDPAGTRASGTGELTPA
jgi:hypothetical protein